MVEGIIRKLLGGFYYVQTAEGELETRARGLFRKNDIKPLVGDRVSVQVDELDASKGYIVEVHKRETELIRPAVANVDQALIVFAISSPKPNIHLLDKMLLLCELSGVKPVIVFNKADLDDTGDLFRELEAIYQATGYKIIKTSTKFNLGIEDLLDGLKGHITVFAGPSGVGKSTLVNTMVPGLKLHTGEVSEKIKRGKHTTRHSEIIILDNGGYVLDTPGFTSLDLETLDKDDIKHYMPEFDAYASSCKFHDCNHLNEPGCKVIQALDEGHIHFSRYQSYKLLMNQVGNDRRRRTW